MGLVQAVKGAVGGVLADQWKDFYTVPAGLPSTAALFAAVPQGTNAGRGSNTSGSSNIITNGSKIIVPEGYGLLLFQDGAITAFVAEPGGYEWRSDDLNSQSIFAGDGLVSTFIKQSWERFKFGGQPGSQQAAYFVSLKELPDNRFGTQSESTGTTVPQYPGRCDHPRFVHSEDRRPDPVREELRTGQLPAAGPGVRLHRSGQRRCQPAVQ